MEVGVNMVVLIYSSEQLLTLSGVRFNLSNFLFVFYSFNISSLAPPTEVEGRSLCNHRRAYKFFIDSVAPNCQFPAFPCDSYEDFIKVSKEFLVEENARFLSYYRKRLLTPYLITLSTTDSDLFHTQK